MAEVDSLIQKATDETLTTDNWRIIMEVCDEVSASPERNTKVAIQSIKTRLNKKDANVILRSLSLLVALAENCGSRMQQEIASTSFLQENLMKKLADKKLHKQLKVKIADTIAQLDNSFKNDPSLRPISDAHRQVIAKYGQYLTVLPDKPAKQELTSQERNQQDLELERALKLSVQEYEREQTMRKAYLSEKPLPQANESPQLQQQQQQQQPQSQSQSQLTKIKLVAKDTTATISTVKKVCALYDLISYEPDELSFRKGDIITVIESVYRDWWRGSLPNGKVGIFPLNYVRPVISKSPEELAHDQQIEADLMNVQSRNVNKLLALLSSQPDPRAEEEITQLYNSIIPHKATIAKLIESYSARKDELRVMNDQLSQETISYNEILDDLVSVRQKAAASTGSALPYPSTRPQYDPSRSPYDSSRFQQDVTHSQHNSSLRPQYQPSESHPRLAQQNSGYRATSSSHAPIYPSEGEFSGPGNYYQSQTAAPYSQQLRY